MSTSEQDRLDLRQAFETVFTDQRLARIAMEALPPIDYSQLATRQDVETSASLLRGEIAELRGEFAELRGEFAGLRGESAELRGGFAGLRGESAELRGGIAADLARLDAKIDTKAAESLRVTVLTALTTTVLLGGYITAVLG